MSCLLSGRMGKQSGTLPHMKSQYVRKKGAVVSQLFPAASKKYSLVTRLFPPWNVSCRESEVRNALRRPSLKSVGKPETWSEDKSLFFSDSNMFSNLSIFVKSFFQKSFQFLNMFLMVSVTFTSSEAQFQEDLELMVFLKVYHRSVPKCLPYPRNLHNNNMQWVTRLVGKLLQRASANLPYKWCSYCTDSRLLTLMSQFLSSVPSPWS